MIVPPRDLQAVLLLCDYAAAVQGKLYITGGGWTTHLRPGQIFMGLALRIKAPWTAGNETMEVKIRLVDEDGHAVLQGDRPVEITGNLTLGRPAGIPVGSDLSTVAAFDMSLALAAGAYRWEVEISGEIIARESFRVVQGSRNQGAAAS